MNKLAKILIPTVMACACSFGATAKDFTCKD